MLNTKSKHRSGMNKSNLTRSTDKQFLNICFQSFSVNFIHAPEHRLHQVLDLVNAVECIRRAALHYDRHANAFGGPDAFCFSENDSD